MINTKSINLYQYNLTNKYESNINNFLKKHLVNLDNEKKLYDITEKIYDKGISGLDLINYIINNNTNNLQKYQHLLIIQKIKREIRDEKIIILFILNLMFFRSERDLENILCM